MDTLAEVVSIPYRYDKNPQRPCNDELFTGVSIPYRYDKNQRCFPRMGAGQWQVSIPYRYDKNASRKDC